MFFVFFFLLQLPRASALPVSLGSSGIGRRVPAGVRWWIILALWGLLTPLIPPSQQGTRLRLLPQSSSQGDG